MMEARADGPGLWDGVREDYLRIALEGDSRTASSLLKGFQRDHATDDLLRQVVAWAQEEIGRRWALAQLSVAEEHLVTAVGQTVTAELRASATRKQTTRPLKIMGACVPGELHSFPLRLACDILELAGHDIIYLGASLPSRDLLAMIERKEPDVVALSCSVPINLPGARSMFDELNSSRGSWKLIAGGRAFTPGSRHPGVDAMGKDIHDLLPLLGNGWA